MSFSNKFASSLTTYTRYPTREVNIGGVPLGAGNPIRIQSMTTTNTMDTIATVEQTIRMVASGCDYVRITAPSINEAHNLLNIKNELRKRGYKVPLIADIHFTPNAAEVAAAIVEKVRINPGNYADKKKFQKLEYTDAEYNLEIEKIHASISPLVKICREHGTAMRIGTNHGSLSDRIMSRYGDTPLGMVESALEFLRICGDLGYHDIVLSMKSSNPLVMIEAYRLLINRMEAEGMNYPLHLGVTEAGDGDDARIKSAMGIGSLLEDGIGDTVRVSLTEDPEFEAPVAISLVKRYSDRQRHAPIPELKKSTVCYNPFEYRRRTTELTGNIGGQHVPGVFSDMSFAGIRSPRDVESIGYIYHEDTDKWTIKDDAADYVYLASQPAEIELPENLGAVYNYATWQNLKEQRNSYPFFSIQEYAGTANKSDKINFVQAGIGDLNGLDEIKNDETVVLVLTSANRHAAAEMRRFMIELCEEKINRPVILRRNYSGISIEDFLLYTATDIGSLLLDGFGDGVWTGLNCSDKTGILKRANGILFGILQAARLRISKTEYISCPSCGRTLFNLQEVTQQIRMLTGHLKGLKIGIMGCIVNGPGEMADADYGYVGSGPGKITLYRGKDVVERSIDSAKAVEALIGLIRQDGKWTDPKQEE